ncbi:hypothetical protein AB1N83_002624 [Pleurotus pulmonarius]
MVSRPCAPLTQPKPQKVQGSYTVGKLLQNSCRTNKRKSSGLGLRQAPALMPAADEESKGRSRSAILSKTLSYLVVAVAVSTAQPDSASYGISSPCLATRPSRVTVYESQALAAKTFESTSWIFTEVFSP